MEIIGKALIQAWLYWCALRFILLVTEPYWNRSNLSIRTNGVIIVIPDEWRNVLSPAQIEAVRCHEMGHLIYFHVWRHFIRNSFFLVQSEKQYERYEGDADDFAIKRGHAVALRDALLIVMSTRGITPENAHPFVNYRLWRIQQVIDGGSNNHA